jgi:hypothetical protein
LLKRATGKGIVIVSAKIHRKNKKKKQKKKRVQFHTMLLMAALVPPELTDVEEMVALEEREMGLSPEIWPVFFTVFAVGPCSVAMTCRDPSNVLIIFFTKAGD